MRTPNCHTDYERNYCKTFRISVLPDFQATKALLKVDHLRYVNPIVPGNSTGCGKCVPSTDR